jgi:hypothetical protein
MRKSGFGAVGAVRLHDRESPGVWNMLSGLLEVFTVAWLSLVLWNGPNGPIEGVSDARRVA